MDWILLNLYVFGAGCTAALIVLSSKRDRMTTPVAVNLAFSLVWPIFWVAVIVLTLAYALGFKDEPK